MTVARPSPSLLIVDDDPDICRALTDFLEFERYQVTTAGTGEEAIATAKRYRFDVAILDLGLPDADGLTVFRWLLDLDPHLPVIILTAFKSDEKIMQSLSQGAIAYLMKPYNKDELRATLGLALRKRSKE